jgi:hypothetical protein
VCCLQTETNTASVLQLVFSHAGSAKDQLTLAAQLLPLNSTMPHVLAGRMQLVVAANTWPRVQQFTSWVHHYGGIVSSLELDVVVDSCVQDAESANAAALDAIITTAVNFKVCSLC